MAEIHRWLLESGSVAYAQDFALAQAQEGLQALEQALAGAPDQAAAAQLVQAVSDLATRNK